MGFVYLTLAAGLLFVGSRNEGATRWFLWACAALNLLALAKGATERDPFLWRLKSVEDRPQWDNYRR